MYSASIFNNNNQNYIITCHYNFLNVLEPIKIFDFNCKIIKEINNSSEKTYFIDIYFDNLLSRNYIIASNYGHIKSYDYTNNELYHIYTDDNKLGSNSIVINDDDKEIIKLIESSFEGTIRIWNFHSGILLNKILLDSRYLNGICLWNNNYLFVGSEEGIVMLIDY